MAASQSGMPRRCAARRIFKRQLKGCKMRILALVTLLTILTGCVGGVSDSALIAGLRQPMTDHARALAGDDITAMRKTGRVVIAKFDAAAQ